MKIPIYYISYLYVQVKFNLTFRKLLFRFTLCYNNWTKKIKLLDY